MTQGLDQLKRIVVLMMENRSFDHMLGGLRATDPRVNGLTGDESNLDVNGDLVQVHTPVRRASVRISVRLRSNPTIG